jgi:hypothetical protein
VAVSSLGPQDLVHVVWSVAVPGRLLRSATREQVRIDRDCRSWPPDFVRARAIASLEAITRVTLEVECDVLGL